MLIISIFGKISCFWEEGRSPRNAGRKVQTGVMLGMERKFRHESAGA